LALADRPFTLGLPNPSYAQARLAKRERSRSAHMKEF